MLFSKPCFKQKQKHYWSMLWSILATLVLSACTHESTIKPSQQHIDLTTPNPILAAETPQIQENDIPEPITKQPYLAPPSAKPKAQTYSIVVYDTPVKEVLFAIARDSNLNIDIYPTIHGNVTLNAVNQTLPAILERLSKQVDLTYSLQNNVLSIAPDLPILRSYKIDYVNMSRDTKGFIGADGQISSASQSSGANGTINNSSGNGANNSSRTSVDSLTSNHLWNTLIQNIKDLLNETDKEVLISKLSPEKDNPANTAEEKTNINQLANARNLQQQQFKTLFAANVIANPETGIISVRATNKQHGHVQAFIDNVMDSAKRQVLIEATIIEVSLKDAFQTGIDWSRFSNVANAGGFSFQQTLGTNINAATSGFAVGYINPASHLGNIAASIKLLQQFGDIKVLSSPKLLVLNNQTAVLKVVDNLVYFTVQVQNNLVANAGSSNTVTTTPNTVPVGIVMSVTPQISALNQVNINVRPTISRKIGDVIDPNPSLQALNVVSKIPIIQVREMESLLQIDSGSTAILGGLMEDTIQKNVDQVPGLANLPFVGRLFKGQDDLNKKTELIIFLRPTVIANASLNSAELASYQQFLPSSLLKSSMNDSQR